MTNKNTMGLLGDSYLVNSNGDKLTDTKTAFWHRVEHSYNQKKGIFEAKLYAWESKTAYRNDVDYSKHITNLFSSKGFMKYKIDTNFLVRKQELKQDGDGVEVTFPFSFNIESEAHIKVKVGGIQLILGTHYTVAFDSGSKGSGSVVLMSPPAIGTDNVVLHRLKSGPSYFKNEYFDTALQEFLGDLDGEDTRDENGTNFKSFTKDMVE